MNTQDFNLTNSIIYLDNAATSLKPKQVIDSITNYYTNYSSNPHRGDYKTAYQAGLLVESTRNKVKELLNAKSTKEIIFTSGATQSLNMIAFNYFKNILSPGDEILITSAEHASNIIPWYILEKEIGIKVFVIPLNDNLEVIANNLLLAITPNTKVISIASTTNVIGDTRPIKEISKIAKENNIYLVVDAAQSITHKKIDVQDLDIDFLALSAHKMCGPTGIGVLYGKESLLNEMIPQNYGGGMSDNIDSNNIKLKSLPTKLEAGTQNIAGIIGFSTAIDYLNNIGFTNIENHINKLSTYLYKKLSVIPHINIINKNITSNIITFNVEGIFSQDISCYLDKHNICLRAGDHCAKLLKNKTNINNSCRISLYFYNTYEELDKLIELLKDKEKIIEGIL